VSIQSGVYCIKCVVNQKFYIGSAVNYKNRWAEHKRRLTAGTHHCLHLQHAWNKYGKDVFEFCLIESVQKENLLSAEQRWINSYWADGVLFNSCQIAGSTIGRKHSQESKDKMRQSHIGIVPSASIRYKMKQAQSNRSIETRLKMSIAQRGKIHSLEEKNKISDSMKYNTNHLGKKDSEVTKKRKSDAQKLRWIHYREAQSCL
jgi:group I intron endonuclease